MQKFEWTKTNIQILYCSSQPH